MNIKNRPKSESKRLIIWEKSLKKNSPSEFSTLLKLQFSDLAESLRNKGVALYLLQKGHLLLFASHDPDNTLSFHRNIPLARFRGKLSTGKVDYVNGYSRLFVQNHSRRALVLCPLRTESKLNGVLAIVPEKRDLPLATGIRKVRPALRSMAALMSAVGRLLREQERSSRLSLINTLCQRIERLSVEKKDYRKEDKIYDQIVSRIQKAFSYDHTAIYLLDKGKGVLRLKAFAGKYKGKIPVNQSVPLHQGIVGWVASHGKTLLSNEARRNPHFLNLTPRLTPTEAELCVPIRMDNEVIGVLNVEHSELLYFDDDDINTIELLADRIGVAIYNSNLYGELHRGHDLLDNVVSSVGHGMMILDKDSRVQWMNKTMKKWGYKDMLGAQCTFLSNGTLAHCAYCPGQRTLVDGRTHREVLRGSNGGFYAVTAAPVRNPSGNVHRILEVIEDVTNAVTTESELARLKEELEEAQELASIAEMAAKVVHEVRNPINAISQAVGLLESDIAMTADQHSMLNVVKEECTRLNDTLSDYLSLAHKQRSFREWEIGSLIRSVVSLLSLDRSLAKRATFVLDIPPDMPPVRLDGNSMKQVFWNLFLNSIEAMDGEGVVKVRADLSRGHIIVTVRDNGKGIEDTNMSKIYEPFFTTKPQGTGLGLAIVKRIIEDHEGTISVQSRVHHGTNITIMIPTTRGPIQ